MFFAGDRSVLLLPDCLTRLSGIRQVQCRRVLDYNRRVFRRLTAAALVVLVQAGAIFAPLMHVHLDDEETGHHDGQALHAHLSGHHVDVPLGPGPIADHQEESGRTVVAQIFVSPAVDPFSLPAVSSPVFVLVVPPAEPGGRTPHTTHATDPPSLRVASPRAPPSTLS